MITEFGARTQARHPYGVALLEVLRGRPREPAPGGGCHTTGTVRTAGSTRPAPDPPPAGSRRQHLLAPFLAAFVPAGQ